MAKDEEKKGNPVADLKWFIIIIVAFWFISKSGFGLFGGTSVKKPDTTSSQKSFSSQSLMQSSKSSDAENKNSKWKGVVTIGRGNASGEQYPRYEYITLKNNSKDEQINITGWSLTNGKDKKYFPVNDKQVKGVSNKVFIPKGTLIFIPNSVSPQEDIVLAPNNEAIITTGNPYGVKTSFRENICNGYIQESEDYNFRPSLNNNCPDPENEEGVKDLDDTCYKFVRQMNSCHTPEFKDVVYKDKEPLTGYVDNVGNLTYSCKEFIKNNYNYNSCVLNHLSDENFFEKKWRIFLNQPFELWAKDREAITLYDKEGKVVDEIVYGY